MCTSTNNRAHGFPSFATGNSVPRRERQETPHRREPRPSFTRHDTRLSETVTRAGTYRFPSNLVGINVLEQAVLAAGESQSSELRRKPAQPARLAVQHPGAVAQLIEDIEAHNEADKRCQANRKLGKMVEDLIQKRLKSHLSLLRIRLKTQFKGYDLRAYVDDPSYADVGSIKVQQSDMLLAKIEIKATRGNAVSMKMNLQEEARRATMRRGTGCAWCLSMMTKKSMSSRQNELRNWPASSQTLAAGWRPLARASRMPSRALTRADSTSNTSMTFATASARGYGRAKRYR